MRWHYIDSNYHLELKLTKLKETFMAKANTHKSLIQVAQKQYLGPNYVRIVFHCEDIAHYANTTLGANNKLFLPNPDQTSIELPEFDMATRTWSVQDASKLPSVRTYTHSDIDLANKTLTMDFAMHGTETVACHWVNRAQIGDEIGVTMGTDAKNIVPPNLEHYVFITDATGLPVTEAVLRTLPASAHAYVIAEVLTPEDEINLVSDAKLEVTWLHNPDPLNVAVLEAELRRQNHLANLPNSRFAHITAEHASVRACRNYLRKEHGWTRDDCYACAYWQIGKSENQRGAKVMDD